MRFEPIELECPKCASMSTYYLNEKSKLSGIIHCKICRATITPKGEVMYIKTNNEILKVYDYARLLVKRNNFEEELSYLTNLLKQSKYKSITTNEFFREYVWVVFASGFKADIVRGYWLIITEMLCDFDISKASKLTFEDLLEKSPIKNQSKLKSIVKAISMIDDELIQFVKTSSSEEIKKKLIQLPYIGKITIYHIMRNIGIDCYKPDRHIVNLANELSVEETELFATVISSRDVSYIGAVDYVLWRACAWLGSASQLVKNASSGRMPTKKVKKDITHFLF